LITDKRDSSYPKSRLLTQHIQEFCQVSPGPFLRSARGPGYEAIQNLGLWSLDWTVDWTLDTIICRQGSEVTHKLLLML